MIKTNFVVEFGSVKRIDGCYYVSIVRCREGGSAEYEYRLYSTRPGTDKKLTESSRWRILRCEGGERPFHPKNMEWIDLSGKPVILGEVWRTKPTNML